MSHLQSSHRRHHAIVVAIVLAFGLTAACAPDPGPPTVGAAITVSKTTGLQAGDVVTISGTGFNATGNLGSRPPLLGQPAGVYVIFGHFAETWKPSAGAGGRTIIVQRWALPEASRLTLVNSWGQDPAELVTMAPDGSWTAQIEIPAGLDGSLTDYGFAVYPGSGASNTGEELIERVTLGAVVPQ